MKGLFGLQRNQLKLVFFFIPAVISTLAIFQGDTTLAPPIVERSLSMLNWACFIMLLFTCGFKRIYTPAIIVVSLLYFFIRNFHVASGVGISFSGFLMLLLMIVMSFFNTEEMITLVKWFRKYMVIMSVVGIIISLDFLIGFGLPHELVEYYGMNSSAYYENYHFSYLFVQDDGIRLCGLFNEPGYMGTVAALLLILERFNFKKIGNIFILIAGGFTLSLAFFVLLFAGLFIKSFSSRRTRYSLIATVVIAIVGVAFFDKEHIVSDYIKEQTTYDKQSNTIGGHSREDSSFLKVKKEFDMYGPKLIGYGTGYCQQHGVYKTSSLRMSFVEWGYLGTFLIYGLLLLGGYATARKDKNAILFLMCFALSILQRPNVFSIVYFLILFGGIYYIRYYDRIDGYNSLHKIRID